MQAVFQTWQAAPRPGFCAALGSVAGPWRHRPRGRPADLGRDLQDGRGRGFWARYGRAGRAGRAWHSRRPFSKFHSRCQSRQKVAAIVAEKSPESRKTSGGISIVAIVAGSKSLAYFASSASMILSASAPYTSSRYFRRSSSGSFCSPRGLSGRRTTSCWSV